MDPIRTVKKAVKKTINRNQQAKLDKNRESGQRLIKALGKARYGVTGFNDQETRKVFSNIIDTFIQYVDNTEIIALYDVADMDNLIQDMITILTNAMKNGDMNTAKRGCQRIHDALTNYRKELNELEEKKKEEVLDARIAKLEKFRAVLETSENIFVNSLNAEKFEKDYNKSLGEYEEIYEKLEEMVKEDPASYEFLQNMQPGIDAVPAEAREMNTNMGRLKYKKMELDNLREAMTKFISTYETQKAALKNLEMALMFQNGLSTEQIAEQMQTASGEMLKALGDMDEEIRSLDEMNKRLHAGIEALGTSAAAGEQVMSNVNAFEEETRRRERLARAREEGMRQKRENEQQTVQMNTI